MLVWVVWDLDVMDSTPNVKDLSTGIRHDIRCRHHFKYLHVHIEKIRLLPRLYHGARGTVYRTSHYQTLLVKCRTSVVHHFTAPDTCCIRHATAPQECERPHNYLWSNMIR